jgi:MFS family permease
VSPSTPRALYYGWIVVAVTFVTTLVAAGIRSAPAIFIHPLEQEFGWTRAAIATAVSINLLLYGLAGPISGRLIDRYGPRPVMLGSLSLLAVGVAGTLGMSTLWQLDLLWGMVVGLGAGGSASVVYAAVASRWFVTRRGVVLGILGSANSTGQLIFIPLLMVIVVVFGWRTGSAMMVALALAMLVPVFLWMRNDPAEVGLQPYGAESADGKLARTADRPPVPLSHAFRAPEFYLLAGAMFTCGATANGLVGTHLIPHSIDHGIPEVAAAATVGVMGGMNVVGTMLSGWLTDRVEPRKLLAAVFAFRGLSLFLLPFVTDFSGLFVFAVIYGLDWFATVPPAVALVARRFGPRSVATVYGWIFLSHQVGAAIMATAGGAIRDWLGDYQMAFLAGGVVALMGAGMALLVRIQHAPQPAPTAAPATA